jgi:arylsulfatase
MLTVRDVLPTLVDFLDISLSPLVEAQIVGHSFLPLITEDGGIFEWAEHPVVIEFLGKLSVRQGSWKLLKLPPPYGEDAFALYDLNADLAERHNLADDNPQVVQRLLSLYEEYKRTYGVIEPDWVSGY